MNMRELMLLGIGLVALLGGAACGGASDGIVDSASEVTGGGAVGGAAQAVAEAVGDQTVAKPHVHPAEPAEAGEAGALAVVEPALANSLRRRVASQCALRLEEDFAALYQLVAPADRERIDLRGFLAARLEDLGLESTMIGIAGPCTSLTPELASYRRDGVGAGRQWSMIYRMG